MTDTKKTATSLELKQQYQKQVVSTLMKEFKHDNLFKVAKIRKIVVNMGVATPQEPRERKRAIDNIVEQFKVITGQKPKITVARKSIAGFKLREGDPMGVMVTLRGRYMWEFLEKLIRTALPRVKDFRGISAKAFDKNGNYNLGLSEQIVFPEINYDQIESIRGLQVTIITSTDDNKESFRLLELLGMPFEKEA